MFKKFALVATMAAAFVAPAFAHTHEHQDVVYDTRGDVVRSAVTKDCVYAANQTTDNPTPCSGPAEPAKELALAERTVYFAFNSTKLAADEQAKLDTLAAYLLVHADKIKNASIVGYADRIGNVKYNDALSKKRAKVVLGYLTTKGVVNAKLAEVRGLGESQPKTECKGDKADPKLISCLAPDRRVEVEIEVVK